MIIIYDESFNNTTIKDDNITLPGRMEAAMSSFRDGDTTNSFEIIAPHPALKEEILLAHDKAYVESIEQNNALYAVASLAAGGAIMAADFAFHQNPSFACIRPPGHHASKNKSWGHCTFNNIAIALLVLREQKRIESAFIIDIDAHTGDGTRTILSGWKEATVFNPYAESANEYLRVVAHTLSEIENTDIIAVSAGFDAYIHDVGHKLETSDFEHIGELVNIESQRLCKGRRFAVLEGGYYLKDLGMNVGAFCRGFSA